MGDNADDRAPILSELLGVQTKTPTTVVVEGDEDLEDRTIDNDSRYDQPCKGKLGNNLCFKGGRRHQPNPNLRPLYVLVSVCLAAVLLMLTALVVNFRWDQQKSAQLLALQEQVQKLEARPCEQLQKQRSHSNDGNSVANYDADAAGGASAEPSALPWRQDADGPPMQNMPGFGAAGLRWNSQSQVDEDRTQDATDGDVMGDDDDDDDDDDDEDDDSDGDGHIAETFLKRIRRSSGSDDKKSKKKSRGGGKTCKRVAACIKERNSGTNKKPSKRCRKILKCPIPPQTTTAPPPPPVQPFLPKAVHFNSDFWNGRRQEQFGKDVCIYIEEWEATACRNRTVRFSQDKMPLKFLEEATWMKEEYKDKSKQPIISLGDGGYKVTQAGLYLIYSSVMFHDNKPRQSQALVVNGTKLFKCMDSVDYIDTDLPSGSNQAKYKSCVMTGVTHLKVNDRLEIQNLYANTEIDLSTDATYFGAVLLSPGEIKTNH